MVAVVLVLLVGLLPASAGQPGTGTTYIYIQNADATNDAAVITSYYDTAGSMVTSYSSAVLRPYVGTQVLPTDPDSPVLPTGFNGSAVVSSDRMVAAVGRTVYTNVPTVGDQLTAGDYTAMSEPATTAFLPYVFDFARNTVWTIQNTEDVEATVYIHYVRRSSDATIDGTEIPAGTNCNGGYVVDTIPANGTVYYDLLNLTRNGAPSGAKTASDKIPCMSCMTTGSCVQSTAGSYGQFEGSIWITSTANIATAASTHWDKFEGVYTGATAEDTFLFYPQVVRVKDEIADGKLANLWVRWSAVIVQNTKNFPVDITVSFIGTTGLGSVQFTDTIPANSSRGYNTRFRGDFPDSLWTNCLEGHAPNPTCALEQAFGTNDWTGAVTVEVDTPGGAIVGVNHVQYFGVDAARVFTYEALQPGTASNIVVCPIMQDQWRSSGGGAIPNKRWSALIVQNASPASTANVRLYLFDTNQATGGIGNERLQVLDGGSPWSIGPGERLGFNTRFDVTGGPARSVFDSLPLDWTGTAVVVSEDEPILGTMSVFRVDTGSGKDFATDYNCYNVPTP
jgi:hypothetical protein